MHNRIKTLIAAGIAGTLVAVAPLSPTPSSADGDIGSIETSTRQQDGGSGGTASATLDATDGGEFSLTLGLDDPQFVVDNQAPAAEARLFSTREWMLEPGRYEVAATFRDVHATAASTDRGSASVDLSVSWACGPCLGMPQHDGYLVHSTEGPTTVDAARVTVTTELVVYPPPPGGLLVRTPVRLGASVRASVGDGGQVSSSPHPSVAYHGPGTASTSASGAIESVTVVRLGPWKRSTSSPPMG